MKIAICDDTPTELNKLREQLNFVLNQINQKPIEISSFLRGTELLNAVQVNGMRYDLAFIDICMDEMNGIQTAQKLCSLLPELRVAFVTSSRDFAVEAFSLSALHYLVKPIQPEMIAEVLRRYESGMRHRQSISIKTTKTAGTTEVTLYLDRIICLSSDHKYTRVETTGGKVLSTETLKILEQRLDHSFLRTSRSMIINLRFVKKMLEGFCLMEDGREITFSIRELPNIRRRYQSYIFNQVKGLGERSVF